MTKVYDNWESLVYATLDREKLRQLALCPSINSASSATDAVSTFTPDTFLPYAEGNRFAKAIQLSYRVIRAAENAKVFRTECLELKSSAQKLTALLRRAARAGDEVYDRPTRRIVSHTEEVLDKALALVLKCRGNRLISRVFTVIPCAAFPGMLSQLENSIGNVSWLLLVSASADEHLEEHDGVPPIAANEPVLVFLWEQIGILYKGCANDRADAAASLLSVARENDRHGKLIVEEGGVGPLLKLVKEGTLEGRVNAARAIGLLGKDPQSVEHLIYAGVCSFFADILKVGPMKVQAVVAWAVAALVAHYPRCQDLFAQHNFIRLLVVHLTSETLQEHKNYAVKNKATKMEDRETKAYMKAMSARALWHLAKDNPPNCRSITETRALLCFAVLLEKGHAEAQYNSAMALMEITAVAEQDHELRRSAFKQNSQVFKAIIDELFKVVEKADSQLLIPCIKTIGNLARSFRATERRMINHLVKLLEERAAEVSMEACVALSKFAFPDNYLCWEHSRAIIEAGGVKHLVQLVYSGEQIEQIHAWILLCYIGLHMPDGEDLSQAEVLAALEWASKQAILFGAAEVESVLSGVKKNLKIYGQIGSGAYQLRINSMLSLWLN